jgi:hypothetical protein
LRIYLGDSGSLQWLKKTEILAAASAEETCQSAMNSGRSDPNYWNPVDLDHAAGDVFRDLYTSDCAEHADVLNASSISTLVCANGPQPSVGTMRFLGHLPFQGFAGAPKSPWRRHHFGACQSTIGGCACVAWSGTVMTDLQIKVEKYETKGPMQRMGSAGDGRPPASPL